MFKVTFNRLMDNFNRLIDNLCACNPKITIKCFNNKLVPIKITIIQQIIIQIILTTRTLPETPTMELI